MKYLTKIINYGLYLFVFLLPWQTRWIYKDSIVGGEVWEYGRWSLYGTEVLLVLILLLGIARCIMERRAKTEDLRPKINLKGVNLWIIVFVVFSGLSILWAFDKGLSWYVWLKFVEGIGLFWLITYHVSRITYQKIKLALIGSGLIQALLGIYQFLTQSTFAYKWLGLSLIKPEALGSSVIEFLDQRWLRAYGAFPHPNILGGFLVICLILLVISMWQLNRRVAESQTLSSIASAKEDIPKKLYWLNLFYWFSVIIIFFGLIITFSRGAWLALLVSLIYLIVIIFKNKLKIEKIVTLKIAIVFILVSVIFLFSFPYQLITTRFNPNARLEKYSLEQRMASYNQAKEILKDSPVIGVGLGNYTKALQQKEPDQAGWHYQPVHNWYWLILVELGFFGLLILGVLIIRLLQSVSTINRSLLIALLLIAVFDHYLWSLYFGVILWWLIASLSLSDNRHVSAKT